MTPLVSSSTSISTVGLWKGQVTVLMKDLAEFLAPDVTQSVCSQESSGGASASQTPQRLLPKPQHMSHLYCARQKAECWLDFIAWVATTERVCLQTQKQNPTVS